MTYDADQMSFLADVSEVTVNGAGYGFNVVLEALNGLGGVTNAAPGVAGFSVLLPEASPIPVNGPVTLTAVFKLGDNFAGSTYILFEGDAWGDLNVDNSFIGEIQVTAVPEPETWLMWLGGLGLLAARYARRQA